MKKIYSLIAVAIASLGYTASAQNELVVGDVKVGDLITLSDGSKWYVGTNEITNGSFSEDPSKNSNNIVGWTVGNAYGQMTTSNFSWVSSGGYDGGAYIQASGHTGAGGNNSVATRWSIVPQTRYYFSFYLAKNSANNQYIPVVSLTSNESTGGGQNEDMKLIGMSGNTADGCLGYGNYIDEDGDGVGDWCQTACSFTSEEYTYLQFNARWLKENKIQACFDGFFLAKLYDPETTSQSQVAYLALQAAINNLSYMDVQYDGLASEASDFPSEATIGETTIDELTEDSELADLQAAIDAVNAKATAIVAAIANAQAFDTYVDSITNLLATTSYPGVEALNNAYSKYDTYKNNGYYADDDSQTASEFLVAALAEIKKSISDYLISQDASPENPADYTFFVNQPKFGTKGNWYIGSTGGDQRVKSDATDNEGNTISCWNAWRNTANFTDNTIQQDLTDIPNGYYTVTADLNTQDGCITDQHIFATSSTSTSVSPVLSTAGWDPMVWETLTTEKIIVVDGKLKIGATSTGAEDMPAGFTDYRGGWFCVTNFKLNYLGEATAEEYAAAIASKFAEAESLSETIHFAADKAAYVAAVASAKTSSDLDALNEAISVANASETEYNNVLKGSYADLQDSIANSTLYSADAKTLVQVPVNYMTSYLASAEASYKKVGEVTAVLRYYRDNLIPALQTTEAAKTTLNSDKAKEVITSTINSVISELSTYNESTEFLAKQVDALKKAIAVAKSADVTVVDGADMTAYIVNPTINDDKASGWTLKKIQGDGNGAKTGQQVDGGSGYYMDTWNTAGIRATWYQVLDVPNGTYTVSNIMRTSGTGAYLFASDKAPVTSEEDVLSLDATANNVLSEAVVKPTNATKYIDDALKAELGGDSIAYYSDNYGEIWLAAADRIMGVMNITGSSNSTKMFDLVVEKNEGSETCPTGVDENDWAIFSANGGVGRGWFNNSVTIEVKNHVLVLGVTCDYAFVNKTEEEKFSGTWFSADNFVLTLTKAGDNTGWDPTTGISDATVAEASATDAIYTISGARANTLQKGINIVKMSDGSVKKVLVK